MNLLDNTSTVTKFWQRNYYEHIIRNETDLQNKTDYIDANPLLWMKMTRIRSMQINSKRSSQL